MLTSNFLRISRNLTPLTLSDIIGGGKNLPPLIMEENINNYIGSHVRGGMGNDHITFNLNMSDDIIKQSPSTPWKYNEEEIVKELLEYIRGTYNQHYSAGDQKIQTLDLIEACGDGEAFCRSNILKYASRYDKNAVRETYNQ